MIGNNVANITKINFCQVQSCPYLTFVTEHSTAIAAQVGGVTASGADTDHVLGVCQVLLPHLHRVQDVDVGVVDLVTRGHGLGGHHPHPELHHVLGGGDGGDGPGDAGLARVVHHGCQGEH